MPGIREVRWRVLEVAFLLLALNGSAKAAATENLEANASALQLEDQAHRRADRAPIIPPVSLPSQHVSLDRFLSPEEKASYLKRAEELDPEAMAAEIARFIWEASFISPGLLAEDRPTQDAVLATLVGATDAQIWIRGEIAGIFKSIFNDGKKDALRDKLKPQWGSEAPAGQATFEGKAGRIGPYEAGYQSKEWVNGFLIYAARTAAEMLRAQPGEPRQTEREAGSPRNPRGQKGWIRTVSRGTSIADIPGPANAW